jgi:L-seryl-tRNA(Ser) seleniumtransferase
MKRNEPAGVPPAGKPTMRHLPAVEKLLAGEELQPVILRYSRPLVTQAVQQVLNNLREGVRQGQPVPGEDEIIRQVRLNLNEKWPGFLRPVINATGVILHTNLGRAPLPAEALDALTSLGGGYINLESDLLTGQRGRRILELRRLINALTGAEDSLVVNNNAAAVLLVLVALAHGQEAIVSRGELVQIGGGFRVPEIMEQSGVTLREVGTTNQTFAPDYEKAITGKTAMVLKVHPSNFALQGFVHEASLAELAALGQKHNLPLVYDLGSGALLDTADYGLAHEPMVPEALASGVDVLCFSGDKLLGGPQAGIIVGKKKYIEPLLKHPLLRVIRLDKLSAVALEATLKLYLDKAITRIPVWRMMGITSAELDRRAKCLVKKLDAAGIKAEVIDGRSMVGGGSLPAQDLPTRLVALKPDMALDAYARRLRLGQSPVIARIENEALLLDLRTVLPEQDEALAVALQQAWTGEI